MDTYLHGDNLFGIRYSRQELRDTDPTTVHIDSEVAQRADSDYQAREQLKRQAEEAAYQKGLRRGLADSAWRQDAPLRIQRPELGDWTRHHFGWEKPE